MTQDIFHWEDVRRRLEIGVRKSIRHFSHCSYICCNYTPGNLLVRYNVFDPLISQSISPFFWKETPLKLLHRIFWNNQVPLFFKEFWLFQFRVLALGGSLDGMIFGGELCLFVELFCVFNAYPAIHYVFSCQVMREHGVCGLALYFFHCIWHCKGFGILFFVIWITVLGNCFILFVGHLL